MQLFIKLNILSILISSFSICYSQTANETFSLAKYQLNTGNFDQAIFSFQRVLCFGSESEKNDSYIYLADCYLALKQFNKAIEFYELAYSIQQNDSMKAEIKLQKAYLYLLQKQYNIALIELLDFQPLPSPEFVERKNVMLGITYFLSGNYQKSNDLLEPLLVKYSPHRTNDLKKIFTEAEKKCDIKIKRARLLSTFIPGLGQWYVGDKRNALNSFLLVSGLTGIAVLVGFNYGLLDAAVALAPWAFRYYAGGLKKVELIAIQKIDQNKQIYYEKLLTLLKESIK